MLTKVTNDLLALGESSGALGLPKGTTAQRPTSPIQGMTRQNTDDDVIEYYDGTEWKQVTATGPVVNYSVDFLVVAGGAGGGQRGGGGGGAGGLRTSVGPFTGGGAVSEPALSLTSTTVYNITVGSGGAYNTNGGDSSFSGTGITTLNSIGGGKGGNNPTSSSGSQGGSGGGGGGSGTNGSGASGTSGQGYAGGNSNFSSPYDGGGGGGAGAVGQTAGTSSGNGGDGIAVNILSDTDAQIYSVGEVIGNLVFYAGGGGGGFYAGWAGNGFGGNGGGGDGARSATVGFDGAINTGGGGGGGYQNSNGSAGAIGGTGGSGVVILRVPTSNYSGVTTGNPGVVTDGTNTILIYTSSGTYTA